MKVRLKIGIIGAGSFGTALLKVFSKDHECLIWDRNSTLVEHLGANRSNPKYLSSIIIESEFRTTTHLSDLADRDVIFFAIPSSSLTDLDLGLLRTKRFILACKGFCADCALPSEILRQNHFDKVLALSGPNFAKDLASGFPCASVLAGDDFAECVALAETLSGSSLKVYPNQDLIGVQLCGALKNIYAIGSGFASGLGLGPSSIFSLLTRSLAELSRIVLAWGGRFETVFGLAGVGDIFMTGSSSNSRNFQFGYLLANGSSVESALDTIGEAVEGYSSLKLVLENRSKFPEDLPVLDSIIRAVSGKFSKDDVRALLQRPIKTEF